MRFDVKTMLMNAFIVPREDPEYVRAGGESGRWPMRSFTSLTFVSLQFLGVGRIVFSHGWR